MIARAFREYMVTRDVFQVLKLHSPAARGYFENFQNITRAHISRNALAFIRFPIHIELARSIQEYG